MWTLLLSRTGDPAGTFFDRRHLDTGEVKIGRSAVMCDIVLPDDEGVVSRTHCTILTAGLELFVLDQSSNGVALNDPTSRIAPHMPVPVRSNDRLIIGSFVITIATEAMGAGISLVPPPPPPLPGMAAQPRGQDAWFDAPADAMWDDGPQGDAMHDFLGGAINDMLAPPGGSMPMLRANASDFGVGDLLGQAFSRPILAEPLAPPADFGIPEDWAGGMGASNAADPFAAMPVAAHDPFRDMPQISVGSDPFGDMPPSPSGPDDPFGDMRPPAPFGDRFDDPPAPQPFDDPFAGTSAPPPRLDDPFDFAPSTAPGSDVSSRDFAAFDSPPPSRAPPPRGAPEPPISGDAWAAFYEGAGLSREELRLAPDAMRRLGVMYRQVVLGLADIMQDRAAFKDEFRVERTQISIGRNNPLKHLPPLDAAKVLMGDPLPGFMDSEDAIRTAFEDAKKHQLAMLAGVQRALTAVFDRLSPPEIEKMIEQATGEKKGFSFRRGVDRWSVYLTVFEALRRDATSNANGVMSVAFREGYEAFLKSAR